MDNLLVFSGLNIWLLICATTTRNGTFYGRLLFFDTNTKDGCRNAKFGQIAVFVANFFLLVWLNFFKLPRARIPYI